MKKKKKAIFLAITMGITACGGDNYNITDLKSYLQAGSWSDNENGITLTFRDDGLYVWLLSYDGKFENDMHESMVRGLIASQCNNMNAYEANLASIIDGCDLPSNASEIEKPGWVVFSDKTYAVLDNYNIKDNTLYVDNMGEHVKVTIGAESKTKFSYKDDIDTYHFSR